MRAYGLYTHIRANQWRSLFFLTVLPCILFLTFSGMAYSLWIAKRLYSTPFSITPAAGLKVQDIGEKSAAPSAAIKMEDGVMITREDVDGWSYDKEGNVTAFLPSQRYYLRSLGKVFTFDEKNKKALFKIAVWTAVGLISWMCVALLIEDVLINLEGGGYKIRRAREPELWNNLENLCISRGIPMPKLSIMETSALNAFSFGYSQNTYGIALTRGLVEKLDKQEIEAVLAHELTHIRNGDVFTMMIATLMVGILIFLSERIMTFERQTLEDPMKERTIRNIFLIPFFFPLFLIVLSGRTASIFIRMVLSKKRDYLADAGAVELTSNPDALISSLKKISQNSDIFRATSGLMTICMDDPRPKSWFDIRPSIPDRIEALQRYAGGVDPSLSP